MDLGLLTSESAGMAGKAVGAAMETLGLYAQAQILNSFQDVFSSLGALIFTCSALGAIISVAVFGNYRQALYLVLGPALFWWMLGARQPVTQTLYQRGGRFLPEEQTAIIDVARRSVEGVGVAPTNLTGVGKAEVSQFFALYDNVISSVIKQAENLILDTVKNQDYRLAARERILSRIYSSRSNDPEYLSLIDLALGSNCQPLLALEQEISSTRFGAYDSAYQGHVKRRLNLLRQKQFNIPQELIPYIRSLGYQLAPQQLVTCDDIWEFTQRGAELASAKLKHEIDLLPAGTEREVNQQAYDDVEKVLNKAAKLSPAMSGAKASQIMASLYLKNSLEQSGLSALASKISERTPWDPFRYRGIFGNVQVMEAQGYKMKIIMMAMAVPYFQGLLLYILCCAFPFFCFLLLIPSRATGFLTWASLWLWVKSWDLGFSVVDFIKDIYWYLMPQITAGRNANNMTNVDINNGLTILKDLYLHDPLSGITTYWLLGSILTLSVPMVTAQLCLGATALYSTIKGGFDGKANQLGRDVTRYARNRAMANQVNAQNLTMLQRGKETIAKAEKDPGKTLNGTDRRGLGGGEAGQGMMKQYQQNRFETNYSPTFRSLGESLALYNGRRSVNTRGSGPSNLLDKKIYEAQEAMSEVKPGMRHSSMWAELLNDASWGKLGSQASTISSRIGDPGGSKIGAGKEPGGDPGDM